MKNPYPIHNIPVGSIQIDRASRQRRELVGVEELAESISRHGLLNPITVNKTEDGVVWLVAGETRLEACRSIDPDYIIPCTLLSDLPLNDAKIIELEENIKRNNLTWQDTALGIKVIHDELTSEKPQWTIQQTGSKLGMSESSTVIYLVVARKLLENPEKIKEATSVRAAYNIIQRELDRATANELNNLLEDVAQEERPKTTTAAVLKTQTKETIQEETAPAIHAPNPRPTNFICTDFNTWAAEYTGRRFNLLHCDFPYGINHGKSAQGGTETGRWDGYMDSEDVYWKLCSTLVDHIDNILTPSAHIVFWLSMKHYRTTFEFFRDQLPELSINPIPLVWFKSDNKGIVSDVTRSPRNVYETALLMSRGDRKIIQPVANLYACPTNKSQALHVSEKPVEMLRHFFRMLVDRESEILDPTCGGGSAIRAAEASGAKRCLGLDLNPEFIQTAETALKTMRTTNLTLGEN